MNIDKIIRKSVARGAAYMDATYPGWHQRIDLDKLNLADPFHCILGQINGNLGSGPEIYSHSARWTARRGFAAWTRDWPTRGQGTPWSLLTAEWRRVISERTDSLRCPTCGSPEPRLHPAVQFEGEVSPCGDAWHQTYIAETPAQQLQRASKAMRERNMEIWTAIAVWIDTHARDLSLANGRIDSCDSPDDVRSAIATAQAYLISTGNGYSRDACAVSR